MESIANLKANNLTRRCLAQDIKESTINNNIDSLTECVREIVKVDKFFKIIEDVKCFNIIDKTECMDWVHIELEMLEKDYCEFLNTIDSNNAKKIQTIGVTHKINTIVFIFNLYEDDYEVEFEDIRYTFNLN